MASLYLHIPFCERKCIYCDFYSIENMNPIDDFLASLHKEIDLYKDFSARDRFDTVFFGGGTPSLLTPGQLESILIHLHATFRIDPVAEITVETNPGTVTRDKLAGYKMLGVNRLSIGTQSFHEEELKFLGRIHDERQAVECVQNARAAGFENINVDLMYALPGQTINRWENNLARALALHPFHVSAYGLTVEEKTPLFHMVQSGQVTPVAEDREAEFYQFTMTYLQENGFEHYEVSNYAKPGYRSRHNYNYWTHGNYLGFGPSAHSFWSEEGTARRWFNMANVSHYTERLLTNALPHSTYETLRPDQLITERIFLGLRCDGLNIGSLHSELGFDLLQARRDLVRELVEDNAATMENNTLRLTQRGYLLCDEICARLIP